MTRWIVLSAARLVIVFGQCDGHALLARQAGWSAYA